MGNRERLTKLTAAALALPGLSSTAVADSPPDEHTVSFLFTRYDEDAISSAETRSGVAEDRYEIEVSQSNYTGPINDQYSLSLSYTADVMSGATPWYVKPRTAVTSITDPTPVQVMSSASIADVREDFSGAVSYYKKRSTTTAYLRFSNEDDYSATSLGVDYGRSMFDQHTRVNAGFEFSDDTIEPTQDVGETERITSASKDNLTLYGSVVQIINSVTTLQLGGSYSRQSGFLSDPYKKAWVFDPDTQIQKPYQDARPSTRNQFIVSSRIRRHVLDKETTWHLDYRLYTDDWGVTSHTLTYRYYKYYGESWQVVPEFRFYTQSGADFYATYFVNGLPSDGELSSDYRLSPFGSVTAALQIKKSFPHWRLSFRLERYQADDSLTLDDVPLGNPGLLSYTRFSLGLAHDLF